MVYNSCRPILWLVATREHWERAESMNTACYHLALCSVLGRGLLVVPGLSVRQAPLSVEFSRRGCQGGLPLSAPGHLPDQGSNPCLCGLLNWPVDAWPLAPLSKNEPIYRTGSEARTDRTGTDARTEQEETCKWTDRNRRTDRTGRDAGTDRQKEMRGRTEQEQTRGQTGTDAQTDRTGTDAQTEQEQTCRRTDRKRHADRQTEADARTEQEETHGRTDRKRRADGQNRLAAKRQGHRGEKNWESEMSRWKRSHTGWRKKEVPLYSARSYIRCPVINHRGQECKIKNVYMCLMSHFSVLQRPARHCKSTILP